MGKIKVCEVCLTLKGSCSKETRYCQCKTIHKNKSESEKFVEKHLSKINK